MSVWIINGPNLNLLGKREPEIYGNQDFNSYLEKLRSQFQPVEISFFQSNIEGEIIDKLHEVGFNVDGIILNAGAYTHTSVAIGDAVKAIKSPVIEVHISNIFQREGFRHISYIAPNARGSVIGFGLGSYRLALLGLIG
ncbi:MAG: type II 3-dehydroquinate dehydratase [Bacteroidetes bacterium 4572_114]|nr:MAG: type II 3-dehydroquinate dehydratase [Bacteroidetes bacterium 4572_114]